MNSYKDSNVKRELIMDHYTKPKHKKNIPSSWKQDKFYSTICVDKMSLGLDIKDNKVIDGAFEGEGCAVFLASVDITLELIKDKGIAKVKELMENYNHMVNQSGDYNEELLDKLIIFSNVKKHLNRVACAMMIHDALIELV